MSMFLQIAAAIVLLACSGLALTGALVQTRRGRLALEGRLDLLSKAQPRKENAESKWSTRLLQLTLQVRWCVAFRMPYQWGMTSGALALLTLGFASGATIWLILNTWFQLTPVFVVPLAAAGVVLAPRMLLRHQQRCAETQFMRLLPDTVDMIVRMLRAGLPITAAIREVGSEAPHPVDTLFTELTNQIAIGMDFGEALSLASSRIGVADFRFFTAAVALQRSTGGNLASTLETLAQIIRRRRTARLKARAATGEVRLTAIVLGAMPFVVTGLLLVMNPGYLAPLADDPRGKIIIAVAVTLLFLGFASMRRLMRSIESI
jgi:tight adherence protein B